MSLIFSGSQKFYALILGAVALTVLALEFIRPYLYLAPDSFTYFTMARHVWDAHLLYSYSGVDHTTGIHPGFYFLLIPFAPLFGFALPEGSLVLGMALVVAGVFVLYRAAGFALAAAVFLCALTPFGAALTNNGMESSLLFFALCLIAAFFLKGGSAERNPLLLGALIGFAVFARLDTIFLAASLFGVFALSFFLRERLHVRALGRVAKTLFLVFLPLFATLLLVFFLDVHYGGNVLPVSGRIKSSFPHVSPHWFQTFLSLKTFMFSLFVSGAYLAWRFWKRRPLGVFPVALFFAALALYFYNGFFVSDIGAWYGALPFFSLALTLGLFVKEDSGDFPARVKNSWFTPVALIVVCGLIVWGHISLSRQDWITPHTAAAAFLSAHGHPGEAAGELKDGVFAFYSSMPVYSLTGLENNQEYIEAVQSGNISEYLRAHAIRYVVGGSFGSGVQVPRSLVDFSLCTGPFYDTGVVQIFNSAQCLSALSAKH